MNWLGSVLQDLGRLDEAEQHYRRSLRMLESQFGSDDPDLLFTLNNLGGLMMVRRRLARRLGSGNGPSSCVNAAIRRQIQQCSGPSKIWPPCALGRSSMRKPSVCSSGREKPGRIGGREAGNRDRSEWTGRRSVTQSAKGSGGGAFPRSD